jgi:hypothetical protein
VTLWKNANGRIMQYRFHVAHHFPAQVFGRGAKEVEVFGQNFLWSRRHP